MPVPSCDVDINQELERLQQIFNSKCENVESCLDSLDDSSARVKSILRKEYTRTMSMIQYMETETTRLLRTTIMETLLKAKAEAKKAKKLKQVLYQNGNVKENQANLMLKLETMVEEIEFLRRNMELVCEIDSNKIQNILKESFYFKTVDCDPMMFRLETDSVFSPKPAIVTSNPNGFKSEFLLNAIEVSWSSVDPDIENRRYGVARIPKLKESVRGLIDKKFAVMKDKQFIELNLPIISSGHGQVEVTLFGKHIINGRQNMETKGGEKGNNQSLNASKFLDEKSNLITNSALDLDLDQSDIVSLDMTKRKARKGIQDVSGMGPGGMGLGAMSLGGMGPGDIAPGGMDQCEMCPPDQPTRGNGYGSLSAVTEVSEQLNDSTPFSIVSEAQCSTMRETSSARLAEMLASASATAELVESDAGVRMQGDNILARAKSELGVRCLEDILAPASESGRRSVEEMQKSLSTESSPSSSRELVDIEDTDVAPAAERSILFAPKTTIFQELATPQVKQDNKRYQVKEGTTKTADGIAGIGAVPRTQKRYGCTVVDTAATGISVVNTAAPGSSVVVPAAPQPGLEHESFNANGTTESMETLPDIITSPEHFERFFNLWQSGKCIKQEINELDGEDTRDKTILEESIWDDDIHVIDDRESHPLENSRWEENINEVGVTEAITLECDIWNLDNSIAQFSFLNGSLKLDKVFESDGDSLTHPTFMTHLRRAKSILIVDSYLGRVGVYDENTLEQTGWFPSFKKSLKHPLYIYALECGSVALIEGCKGINIYNYNGVIFVFSNMIKGDFRGLAESEDGELITLEIVQDKHFVRFYERSAGKDEFKLGNSIELKTSQSKMSDLKALPRYLVYRKNKVYISDYGAAKIYILDILTGHQESVGFYGRGSEHLVNPLPLLVDDHQNILVADQYRKRIHVFDAKGIHAKRVHYKRSEYKNPYGFLRLGNFVYLSFWAKDRAEKSGVVRFVMKEGSSAEEERPQNMRMSSPLDVLL